MNQHNPSRTPDALDRIDDLLSKTERIFRAARWIFFAILAGALWVARAEWSIADHERRITSVEGDVKPMAEALARVKGRLSITAAPPPTQPPSASVVWSEDQRQAEEEYSSASDDEQAPH
jgi:hypothetical protein